MVNFSRKDFIAEIRDELVKTVPICCHCHHIITFYSEERDFEFTKQLVEKYGRENIVIEVNEVDVPHVGVTTKPDYDKYML